MRYKNLIFLDNRKEYAIFDDMVMMRGVRGRNIEKYGWAILYNNCHKKNCLLLENKIIAIIQLGSDPLTKQPDKKHKTRSFLSESRQLIIKCTSFRIKRNCNRSHHQASSS